MNTVFDTHAVALNAIDVGYVKKAGFHAFIEVAWDKIDPAPFVGGWHIEEVAAHLEAVYYGQMRNLIINVPPGTSKSSIVCVLFNLWVWIQDPRKKFIYASHDPDLAMRDARRTRNMLKDPWWKERWPHVELPRADDSTAVSRFFNTKMGFRLSVGVGQQVVTGWHGDIKIIDDPNKPMDMDGKVEVSSDKLLKANSWYDGTFSSRNTNVKTTATVLVMQRLGQVDLTGHILEQAKSGDGEPFEHLRLPMEYNADKPCRTSVGGDRRKVSGELLCPGRYDAEAVVILKQKLRTARNIAAQMEQEPSSEGGNIIKAHWLRHWGPCSEGCKGRKCPGPVWEELPKPHLIKSLEQSWDLTFGKTDNSDFVCGQVWGRVGQYAVMMPDQVHEKLTFTETINEFRGVTTRWPAAFKKRIEKAANAAALANVLQSKIPGILLEVSCGSKEQYLRASEPMFAAGMVVYPSPRMYPWVETVNFHELLNFPSARHDDSVDATTHALFHMVDGNALEQLKKYIEATKRALGMPSK